MTIIADGQPSSVSTPVATPIPSAPRFSTPVIRRTLDPTSPALVLTSASASAPLNPSLLSVRILELLTWNAAVCAAVSVADRSRQSPSNESMMAPVIGCCPNWVFVWYSEGGRHLRYFDLTPIPTLLEKFMNHPTGCPSVCLCLEIQNQAVG